MKTKTLFFILCAVVISAMFMISASCARSCDSVNRSWQTGDRNYEIWSYSGDSLIFHDKFRGILNNQKSSDGYYYYKGDTLIEVSGNTIVKSLK